ncbi:unnamed protein product, partial [Prorocentrum cordatum]
EKLDSLESQHILATKEVEQLRRELVETLPSSAAAKSQLNTDTDEPTDNPDEQALLEQSFASDGFKLYKQALERKEAKKVAPQSPFDADGDARMAGDSEFAGPMGARVFRGHGAGGPEADGQERDRGAGGPDQRQDDR